MGNDGVDLYWRTWPELVGVLMAIGASRAEAEAVAQDAYLKLLRRWHAIARYDDPEVWVRAHAVRSTVRRVRRRKWRALLTGRRRAGLTPDQRAVAVLHDVLELPIEQIADDLQLRIGATKARLAEARRRRHPAGAPVELTADDVPPFERLERRLKERRARQYVVFGTVGTVVGVAAVLIGIGIATRPGNLSADPEPTIGFERPGYVVDGPAPRQYELGPTRVLLRGEIAVTSARPDPRHLTMLTVGVEPDNAAIGQCMPDLILRILAQDAGSVRIAAYRYDVGPDQSDGHRCAAAGPAPTSLQVDLQSPLGNRTVYAGTKGERIVLRGRECRRQAGSFAARCR
ncbi:RNA polymerase sigma factor [Kribbella sp. WER1]